MTARWSQKKSVRQRFVLTLAEHQGWTCPICGRALEQPSRRGQQTGLSIDHVWPRLGSEGRTGLYGNALATHAICNNAKGARVPTGCEIIWLTFVNAKMDLEPHPRTWHTLGRTPTLADLWPA